MTKVLTFRGGLKGLEKIVEDIDNTGKSNYSALRYRGRTSYNYDYRKFDLGENNLYVRRHFFKMKYSYEYGEE